MELMRMKKKEGMMKKEGMKKMWKRKMKKKEGVRVGKMKEEMEKM
jgi:hypothetical protein